MIAYALQAVGVAAIAVAIGLIAGAAWGLLVAGAAVAAFGIAVERGN